MASVTENHIRENTKKKRNLVKLLQIAKHQPLEYIMSFISYISILYYLLLMFIQSLIGTNQPKDCTIPHTRLVLTRPTFETSNKPIRSIFLQDILYKKVIYSQDGIVQYIDNDHVNFILPHKELIIVHVMKT